MALDSSLAGQIVCAVDNSYTFDSSQTLSTVISSLIRSVRERLRMEVGFVSHFRDGHRVFKYVDTAFSAEILSPGMSDPLDESYCQRVVDGRLPELMTDARNNPEAQTLQATEDIPVGAHISVPVILSDGSVFGTFCLFSRYAVPGLDHRSLALVRVFADVIAALLDDAHQSDADVLMKQAELSRLIESGDLSFSESPVYCIRSMDVQGYELKLQIPAFLSHNENAPSVVLFYEAERLGMLPALGVAVAEGVRKALAALPANAYVSINVTPAFLMNFNLCEWLTDDQCSRLYIELSEHDQVPDYLDLNKHLQPIRDRGVKIIIDDAGAGFASMRHILQLRPEIIKVDEAIVRGINSSKDQQALVTALQVFARMRGSHLIAEGVVCCDEHEFLCRMGIDSAQGIYYPKGVIKTA